MPLPADDSAKKSKIKSLPPGRIKITQALKLLLERKEFSAVTTAEIAKQAGVTEALIYKYFKDKRDLLHQVLREYLEQYQIQVENDLKGIKGALNRLRKLIWSHINVYATNRVFAVRSPQLPGLLQKRNVRTGKNIQRYRAAHY